MTHPQMLAALDAFLDDPRPHLLAYIQDCFAANPGVVVPAYETRYHIGSGLESLDLSIIPNKQEGYINTIEDSGVRWNARNSLARYDELPTRILLSVCRRLRDEMFRREPEDWEPNFMQTPKIMTLPAR